MYYLWHFGDHRLHGPFSTLEQASNSVAADDFDYDDGTKFHVFVMDFGTQSIRHIDLLLSIARTHDDEEVE